MSPLVQVRALPRISHAGSLAIARDALPVVTEPRIARAGEIAVTADHQPAFMDGRLLDMTTVSWRAAVEAIRGLARGTPAPGWRVPAKTHVPEPMHAPARIPGHDEEAPR